MVVKENFSFGLCGQKTENAYCASDEPTLQLPTAEYVILDSDSKHQTRVGESGLAKSEAVYDIHSAAKVHKTVNPSGAFGIRNAINNGKGNALDSTTDEEVISSLDDIRELQPILNIRKDSPSLVPLSRQGDLCFSSGLMGPDGTNRYLGRWCKRGQSKESVAMQGSELHLKNQICGTTSGNDGRTKTANIKEEEMDEDISQKEGPSDLVEASEATQDIHEEEESSKTTIEHIEEHVKKVEIEVDEHPSATKTTENTCSQKEETKEQEECGLGVQCNIDMQKNGSNEFDEESQAEATLILCDNMSAISMARNPD